jgi:hypothetical protein
MKFDGRKGLSDKGAGGQSGCQDWSLLVKTYLKDLPRAEWMVGGAFQTAALNLFGRLV